MLNNKLSWIYGTDNGFEICDDVTAELGFQSSIGTEFKIAIEGTCYKNYTVDDDGVTGDECSYTDGQWGYTAMCVLTKRSSGASGDPELLTFEIPADNPNLRLAMYLIKYESGSESYIAWDIISYNIDTHAWGYSYPWMYTDMDTSMRLFKITIPYSTTPGYVQEYNARLDYLYTNYNKVGGFNFPYASYFELTKLATNIPLFDSLENAKAYLQDLTNETIDGILNLGTAPDPEEEYKEQFDFWYIKSKWGHNTRNTLSPSNIKVNYRFKPKRQGIAFVRHTPTASEPWDRELVHYNDYDAYSADWGATDDDDFSPISGISVTHFLTASISFGANDYYTKFDFVTNIPTWDTMQDADDYFNGLKDISEASNYAYISRQDASILNPDLPGTDIDESTAIGTNGMRYSYGNRLYEITNLELASLMAELYTPANFQDIIDGNKLFGSNAMEAISGVIYIPLTDLSSVCEMGSTANIKIGAWESQNAQGKRIIKNEGTIDCGSFFYNRIYQDFRDYEPYNLLFANLPFVGCHQLTISKYIDKTVSVQYNIDITTGAIVCKLLADGILVDIFDGTCGASRPISATDNNAYINAIMGAITGSSASASGSIEGITNAVGSAGKMASSSGALMAGGATLGAVGIAGGVAVSGVFTGYQIKNAVDNPPQMHRGSLAGNLAYNLNTRPTFLFFTKRTIRPENELDVVGYPSGHGGQISHFSGFLSATAVKLSSFNGTDAEENELLSILQGGIYI